jgi:hypothetical protein
MTQEIWRARFETPSFTLETFASSEENARGGLILAWRHHCEQTGADPEYLVRYAGDVQAQQIFLGVTYRDRERFFPVSAGGKLGTAPTRAATGAIPGRMDLQSRAGSDR